MALVFAHEVLSVKAYIGALLMLASIFVMEIDFKALTNKKKNREEIK